MKKVIRFGVSIEKDLIKKFDIYIHQQNYSNRSEAIRDLIRKSLVEDEWVTGKEIAGGIVMVYDHHKRQLVNKLIDIQHDFCNIVISNQHIHLDHNNCLEMVVVKGKSEQIRRFYNLLKSTKGIKHITLAKSTTGGQLV